ncbi:hypothetical protein CR513_49306, partial [Mucuna pruriens]
MHPKNPNLMAYAIYSSFFFFSIIIIIIKKKNLSLSLSHSLSITLPCAFSDDLVDPMARSPSNIDRRWRGNVIGFPISLQPSMAELLFGDRSHPVPNLSLARSVTKELSVAIVVLTQCLAEVYGVREGNWVFPIPSVLFPLSFHTSSDERSVNWFC